VTSTLRRFSVLAVASGFLLTTVPRTVAEELPVEYTIKAAYLYNFARFVDWPAQGPGSTGPIELCILGEDPFGEALEAIEGRTAQGRPMVLRRLAEVAGTERCHILYLGPSEAERAEPVLEHLRGLSVLTVGDFEGFAQAGGMIGFVIRADTVRLQINPAAVRRSGLRISAKLLELSEIVDGGAAGVHRGGGEMGRNAR
jgi:hypothetical protein